MNEIDIRIQKFIRSHHVLTLATALDNQPYCCSCFYAWNQNEGIFVFSSDEPTKHIQNILINPLVAGTVHLETKIIGKIQGLQYTGKLIRLENELLEIGKSTYLKRFPFAILMNTTLWGIKVNFLKLTDNRLGFGTKLSWTSDDK